METIDSGITMMILMPSRGVVDIKWFYHNLITFRSFIPPMLSYQPVITDRRSILDAFNAGARACLKNKIKYLAILEDDVFAPPCAFEILLKDLREHPDHGIATGVYFRKMDGFADPLVFRGWEEGPAWDWKPGDILLDVAGGSQGIALVDVSIFEKIPEPWFRWDWTYKRESDGKEYTYPKSADLWLFYACKRFAEKKVLVDCGVLTEHHCRVRNKFYPDNPEQRERYGYPMVGPFLNTGEAGRPSDMAELRQLGVTGICKICGHEAIHGECHRCGSGEMVNVEGL